MKTRPSVRKYSRGLVLALCLPTLTAFADTYTAEAIEAWVVDEATGNPIEGVVVVAHWQAETGNFGGRFPASQVMIQEAVADKNGRFYFPAWGPKTVAKGIIEEKRPRLILFKKGYEYRELVNSSADKPWGTHMRSSWQGQKIGLKVFEGNMAAYARHLSFLDTALSTPMKASYGTCDWQSFPKILRALHMLDADFAAQKIMPLSVAASLRANEEFYKVKGCGSVKELLKSDKE